MPDAVPVRSVRRSERGAQQAASDRRVGILSLFMWAGTAIKCYNLFNRTENICSALGLVAMAVLVVGWPTYYLDSYTRWRLPIVAFLRLFLFALPFNFTTKVVNVIAPTIGTGRLGPVVNTFHLFMATRVALLTFTSLGWRVPFKWHMPLQATQVAMLVTFAVQPYCNSILLSSPEINAGVASVHSLLASLAMPLLPPSASILVPKGEYAQRVAILLFAWLLLGWLLPTLLLLPDRPSQSQSESPSLRHDSSASSSEAATASTSTSSLSGSRSSTDSRSRLASLTGFTSQLGDHLVLFLDTWLRKLFPGGGYTGRRHQSDEAPGRVSCLLHWWVLLLMAWCLCCTVAPLFVPPHGA